MVTGSLQKVFRLVARVGLLVASAFGSARRLRASYQVTHVSASAIKFHGGPSKLALNIIAQAAHRKRAAVNAWLRDYTRTTTMPVSRSTHVHDEMKEDSMNRLVCAASVACAVCVSPAFAQSNSTLPNDAIQQPATTFPSAAIAQNFQYMNHPPPPAPASSAASMGGGRGHRRRQTPANSDSNTSAQP
jgi:hypothetical protein